MSLSTADGKYDWPLLRGNDNRPQNVLLGGPTCVTNATASTIFNASDLMGETNK